MLRWAPGLAVALGVLACKFPELPPIDESDARDATGDDGGVDAGPCPGELFGYAISNISACDLPSPGGDLDLSLVTSIDTFAGTMTSQGGSVAALPGSRLVPQPSGPMLRVVSVAALGLPQNVTIPILGEYPISFIVWGDATVAGTLSLTGIAATTGLPAGRRSECGTGSGTAGTGGGGGGGGALGGDGGSGGVTNNDVSTRGQAGTPLAAPARSPLYGGCAGSPGSTGALPGSGGGALQISVSGTLTVTGAVTAGGGGGSAGGAGGGSGGMILLEAGNRITVPGSLTANGGGGGGGGGDGSPGAGQGGCTSCSNPAIGGAGGGGGSGGSGGAASIPATSGGNSLQYGGGGGGGGVGVIWLRAPGLDLTGTLSPLPRTSSL